MPATADPPNATIVPAAPQKPLPAPTTTINVSQLPKGDIPSSAPKPGSARAKMREELSRAAGIEPPKPPPDKPKSDSPAADSARTETDGGDESSAEASTDSTSQSENGNAREAGTSPSASPSDQPKAAPDKKLSPWKLVDQFKERATKAEARALELERQVVPEADRKATSEKIGKYEQRIKELEDVVRYADYRNHPEFQEKYQKPYEASVARAMRELGELTVGEGASARPVNANDIFELVSLPLPKAREIANQVFGDFADDVMFHRKEIKTLFEAQNEALQEAKKNGAARETELREKMTRQFQEVQDFIKTEWDRTNQRVLAHEKIGEFFKPREGDEAWNSALTKGFEFVDSAFEADAKDPRLTTEQRAAIIRRHAAVRNRAAGWDALRIDRNQWKSKYEAVQKELEQYKASTPSAGGQQPATASSAAVRPKDAMYAALQKLAK